MIASWRDEWLRKFFVEDLPARKFPSDIEDRLYRRLLIINLADSDSDLRLPTSNHFEKLSGGLEGWCSIRVNLRWRLIFRWDGSTARDIYLDDHSYR